uniref:Uncharacterized protein n=1 Tax=Avena sativa TaxID=4498 RepID=A0ACD5TZV9_AVESA
MKDEWQLPDTAPWANYGDEWVLALLDGQSELQRTRILMTLWRCWHIRNEIVHDKPAASIESSRRFLCSYLDSLMTIKHCPQSDDVKGKQPAAYMLGVGKNVDKKQKLSPPLSWRKPDAGAVKLNVDGSYNETSGEGGTGMILRDNTGAVLFLACRFLPLCSSPLEAELQACLEGIQKARSWTDLPCVVESECKEVVSMLSMTLANRSHFAHVVQEIKELLKDDPRFQIVAVFRQQNKASHLLANFGRSTARTVTWIRSAPENVLAVCLQEGPPVA